MVQDKCSDHSNLVDVNVMSSISSQNCVSGQLLSVGPGLI